MNPLSIRLDADRTDFEPGELIHIDVEWSLADAPDRIELRFVWNTVGIGTRDIGVELTETIEDPIASGSRQIKIEAPVAPYSFSGQFVSLAWGVELVAFPSGESCRKEICIAPGGKAVVLTVVPK